jgi:hypothetical protein
MRVAAEELRRLPLEAHAILADVPLQDVSAVDLPGGGPGRTLADVRALAKETRRSQVNPLVRGLFGLRMAAGRLLGWDRAEHARPDLSYRARLSPALVARSLEPPGTADGAFQILYMLEREGLQEIRNATVHAFLAFALDERPGGYRLYWAVYVKPVSRLTPLYLAAIEPFRRFIVYPALLGGLRRAWIARYGQGERTSPCCPTRTSAPAPEGRSRPGPSSTSPPPGPLSGR